MTTLHSDFTPVIDLLHEKGAGPVRTRRPLYVDLLPPCNNACPAGENVQAWLDLAQAGKHREAWETILRDNPFPAVHGRVCYHPCETRCNRAEIDSAVSIHAVRVPRRPRGGKGLDLAHHGGANREAHSGDRGRTKRAVGGLPSCPPRSSC